MELGVQLFSFQGELKRGYYETLRDIAALGFTNVELLGRDPAHGGARFSERTPGAQAQRWLDDLGLVAVSVHEGMPTETLGDLAQWNHILDEYEPMRVRRVALPGFAMQTRDEALTLAERFTQIGELMRGRGFQFLLHTHTLEFAPAGDGRTWMDVILEQTDPALVQVEFDLTWALRGGVDLLAFLRRYRSRCELIHQQDVVAHVKTTLNVFDALRDDPAPPADFMGKRRKYFADGDAAEIGTGVFDFAGLYPALNRMENLRYVVMENELPFESKLAMAGRERERMLRFLRL